MQSSQTSEIVKNAMEHDHNCCEAVLMATQAAFHLPFAEDMMAAASMFGEGMGSGCSCGALVGMVMASGILNQRMEHPRADELPQLIYQKFKQEFGSTCCRVIRKNRPVWQRIGRQGCIQLTTRAAEMLLEEWENVYAENATPDISSSSCS